MKNLAFILLLLTLLPVLFGCYKEESKQATGEAVIKLHYQEADAEGAVWTYGLTKVQIIRKGEVLVALYGSPSQPEVRFKNLLLGEEYEVIANCTLQRYYTNTGQTFESKGITERVEFSTVDSVTNVPLYVFRMN